MRGALLQVTAGGCWESFNSLPQAESNERVQQEQLCSEYYACDKIEYDRYENTHRWPCAAAQLSYNTRQDGCAGWLAVAGSRQTSDLPP